MATASPGGEMRQKSGPRYVKGMTIPLIINQYDYNVTER
jgi:hypothetical protein